MISPAVPPAGQASSPFSRAAQAAGVNPYRFSTSQLNPPGHNIPNRNPSLSSFGTGSSTPSSARSGQRFPPHIQAFRNAAAASASPSLFPPTQASDRVPLRQPVAKAGSVAHPVTAWHPPAPSIASIPAPGSRGLSRGHSRKSSLAERSAFASTAKAKKLGFFKKKKQQPFMPGAYPERELDGRESTYMETRSMMTWMTKGEGKCVMM